MKIFFISLFGLVICDFCFAQTEGKYIWDNYPPLAEHCKGQETVCEATLDSGVITIANGALYYGTGTAAARSIITLSNLDRLSKIANHKLSEKLLADKPVIKKLTVFKKTRIGKKSIAFVETITMTGVMALPLLKRTAQLNAIYTGFTAGQTVYNRLERTTQDSLTAIDVSN